MSYGSSSASEHDGGDPEELRNSLAEIKNRISVLARQCEAITQRNGNAQPHHAPNPLPSGVPEALGHFNRSLNAYFARRFEQISSASEKTDVSRSLNGRRSAATNIAEAEKEPGRARAGDMRGGLDQVVDSRFAEINKTLANITHKIAELTNRFEQQISASSGIRATEAAEREASLLVQVDKIAARLSDKYDREGQLLARNLEDQVKRSLSEISLPQHAPSEFFIKEFVDKINGRLAAIAEQFSAELANMRKKTNAISADVEREIAGRANRKGGDSANTEVFVKKLQEHLDRCVSEISAYSTTDAGKTEQLIATIQEQAAKLSKIDRVVSALSQRVDGLIGGLAESERANSAERTALVGSLDEKIAALAEKGRTETVSLARTLGEQIEGDVLKVAAELARTIELVTALETKIAALADKGHKDSATLKQTLQSSFQELSEKTRAETERTNGSVHSLEAKIAALGAQTQSEAISLAKALNDQIESQALRLTQNAQTESAKTTVLVGSLEQKLAALTQTSLAHSEALAKALHQKIETQARELEENTRAQAAKTTSFIQSLEKQIANADENTRAEAAKTTAWLEQKIATLAEKNKTDSEFVARTLGQQIEHHVQALTEYTSAEAARTAALVGSLERTVTVFAEKSREDSESLAKGLGQEIAGHVLRLTESTRAATAKTLHLMGSLEDKMAALAEQGRSESDSLAQTLSQEIERRVLALTESTRAEMAAATALFESKITALSGKVQADTESSANALSRQIESSVRQLAESAQADAAKTATLVGSLGAKVATMAERGSAESTALAQTLTQQIEGHAQQLGEKIRAESAGTTALFEQRIAGLTESGKADTESLQRALGQKIDAHVQQLAETTRTEAAKTTALLDNKIAAVAESTQADAQAVASRLAQQIETHAQHISEATQAEAAKTAAAVNSLQESVSAAAQKSRADSESLRQNLGQQIKAHSAELSQNTREEVGKTRALIEEKIAALAESGKAASESLAQTLSQQIETEARELSENMRAEAVRTTDLFENKIAALAEKSQADAESLGKTLSQQIENRSFELSENTKAEAAKTTALLENKIAAFAEKSEVQVISLEKTLSHQIESHVRALTENGRTDTAKITALIGSLEEKTAAFAEQNRAALEAQANVLAAQLKVQLAEMSEANRVQAAEFRKLLDTGMGEIEHSIATISEASRAEFQSRFKAIDEQFHRQLDELSQQNVARTEALAEALRHRVDLGVTALIEGSKAEAVALESLIRTLMEQIYRKVGAFSDSFRSEFDSSHKKIDALRNSIGRQLEVLTESSQEHFSRLTELTGGQVGQPDGADAQLSHFDAAHADEAQPVRPHTNGKQPHAQTNGHASARLSDPAETIGVQDFEHLAARTHDAEANGSAIAAVTNGGELAPTNGMGAALNGRLDVKSDGFHTDDPIDPLIAAPERALVSDTEEPSKRKPRNGYMRRWFGFNRAKY